MPGTQCVRSIARGALRQCRGRKIDRGPARYSDARERLEEARLAPGDLDFGPIAQLSMEAAVHAPFDALDELEIDDLTAVSAEELGSIQALLDGRQSARQQRLGLAP